MKATAYRRAKFATRYTTADATLWAYVDKAHGNLSGPATRRILEREYSEYHQAASQRLAAISVAHLYWLHNTEGYRNAMLATSRSLGEWIRRFLGIVRTSGRKFFAN